MNGSVKEHTPWGVLSGSSGSARPEWPVVTEFCSTALAARRSAAVQGGWRQGCGAEPTEFTLGSLEGGAALCLTFLCPLFTR